MSALAQKRTCDALKLRCPLYPRKRTSLRAPEMSALGLSRTHAPQRNPGLSGRSPALGLLGRVHGVIIEIHVAIRLRPQSNSPRDWFRQNVLQI